MKMKNIIVLLLISIGIIGCNENKRYSLKELSYKSFTPEFNNYSFLIHVKGENDCPVDFSIYADGKKYETYKLGEKVDTIIRNDWYQNVMTFKVDPVECITDNILVEVNLMN